MNMDSLRDLLQSGVKWELKDTPSMARANKPVATDSAPVETSAQSEPAPGPRPAQSAIVTPAQPLNTQTAQTDAQTAADSAGDWNALCDAIAGFQAHPLQAFAKNTVLPQLGNMNLAKKLVVITDSISADDEEHGTVLSGPAGELFDKMMGAIGLGRADLTIIPLVFWRTPGGRGATASEMEITRPFVKRAITLAGADAILTLGATAATEIADVKLPTKHGIQTTASRISMDIPVFPIFAPSYLILKPDAKRDVWAVLQQLQIILN